MQEEVKVSKPIEETKADKTVKEDDDDFDVKYKAPKETFDDLKPLQNKPLFISDLIQGLQSEDYNRFCLALSNAEGLIREQKSNDLEIMATDFLQTLFRTVNTFDQDDFMQLKYAAMQATLELAPKSTMTQIALRIQDSEASIGEKTFLFETIGNAAVGLSESVSTTESS